MYESHVLLPLTSGQTQVTWPPPVYVCYSCITNNHNISEACNTRHLFSHNCRLAMNQLLQAGLSLALLLQAIVAGLTLLPIAGLCVSEGFCPTCLSSTWDQWASQDQFLSCHKEAQMSK